ncbi:MAG: BamA/TamA family outer membrane protein [Proteobacteria bacterium]|nr:BamA/TamA family outer membrane protein [Pseudomonadota bacterium]
MAFASRNLHRLAAGLLLGAMLLELGACASAPAGRRWIDRVELRGTAQLEASKIVAGLETQPTPWWWWLPLLGGRRYYDPAALDSDLRRIERYYRARGFFSVRTLDETLVDKRDGQAVDIRLEVDEGRPSRVLTIAVEGLAALPRASRQAVLRRLPLRVGGRFDYAAYGAAASLLRARLRALGYAYATCAGTVAVDRDRLTARVTYRAVPGPLLRIGPIVIEGAGDLPLSKLARAIAFREGDVYRPEAFARTRARLLRHQVFAAVELRLPKSPVARAPVTIDLTPTKLREIRLGGGMGVDQRWQEIHFFSRFAWRNFLGGLRNLELRLQPKFVTIPTAWAAERGGFAGAGELRLTQPDLLGSAVTAFGLLSYELGLQEGYRYHGPRLQLGADRTFWAERVRGGVSWSFQYLRFFDVTTFDAFENPLGVGVDGSSAYRLAWIEPFLQLDWRDSIIDPRRGLFAELRVECGFPQLGGRFSYLKFTPDLRGYLPLGSRRLVLALRAIFSQLVALDDGSALGAGEELTPVTRRIWFGGATSHRAFGYRRLSPQVFQTKTITPPNGGPAETVETGRLIPIGGDSAVLLSAELRLRTFKLYDQWLQLITFFDAGDVVEELDALDLKALQLGLGAGVQYQTPIGSLGVAIGLRLNRRRSELSASGRPVDPDPRDNYAFHLTLGEAF